MADPMATGFNFGDWAFRGFTGLLGLLGWNMFGRMRRIEIDQQTRADAQKQREEIRDEIADVRENLQHLGDKFDQHSSRTTESFMTILSRLPK